MSSPIVAGDSVILAAATKLPSETVPMFGNVASATAGPPPTNVVVDWSNGTQVAYAAIGTDSSDAVLLKVTASQVRSFLGQIVRIIFTGDPGSRVQGRIVQQYLLLDPSGDPALGGEIVVIETPVGFITTDTAFIVPITN